MEARLRRLGPHSQVKELHLTDEDCTWTAGRGSNSDIFTLSRFASRKHFSIIYRGKNFYILDHGSSNGTFVNDRKIHSHQEYTLPLNSIISVGVLSSHQSEPDCIVLAFEISKEKQTTGKLRQHIHEEDTNKNAERKIMMERVSVETKPDKETEASNLKAVHEKPIYDQPTSSEALTTEEIEITRSSTLAEMDKSDLVEEVQQENNNAVKSDLVPEVLCMDDLIEVNKGTVHDICTLTKSTATLMNTEEDSFELEVFAHDEKVHAEIDELVTRTSRLPYSKREDFIESGGTKEVTEGDFNINVGNVRVVNHTCRALNSPEGGACMDSIKSNTRNQYFKVSEIRLHDDDNAYTETDKKWFGKLFKSQEECCLFIQSQRENSKNEDYEESDDDWIECIIDSAEQIGQILVAESEEGNVKVGSRGESVVTPKRDNIALGFTDSDNKNVVRAVTSPENQEADSAKSEICSISNLNKRSLSSLGDKETSGNSKKRKLVNTNELGNVILPELGLSIPTGSERLQFYDKQPEMLELCAPKITQIRSSKRTPQKSRKVEGLSASEKQMIKDYRRKKLRELSLRQPPKEVKIAAAPKVLPPLKVKITMKNRSEYLCHQMRNKKNSDLNGEKAFGELDEKNGENSEFTREKNELVPEDGVKTISPVKDNLQEVQHTNIAETEGSGLSEGRVLCDELILNEARSYENVEVIMNDEVRKTLKSCLKKFGYCFMRSNKPIVPLKTVRFDDTVNVRYYEIENRITRKTSMLQYNIRNKTRGGRAFPSRNVITSVCSWKVTWLKECKRAVISELPPIFSHLKNVQKKFPNHENYIETFVPLLLLDLWQTISRSWRVSSKGMYQFSAVAISQTKILGHGNENLRRITCEGGVEVSPGVPLHVREGDLVMIKLLTVPGAVDKKMTEGESENDDFQFFGVIDHKVTAKVAPNQTHSSLVHQQCSLVQPNKRLSLDIFILNRPDMVMNSPSFLQITGVYHVDPQLLQCQAVCGLAFSPLCQLILSPNLENLTLSRAGRDENITFTGPLDDAQRELILSLVSSCINRDHNFLQIQGGPGTGKTHLIVAFILQLLFTKQWKGTSRPIILYCAHSNIVVDDMALKLKNYRKTLSSKYKLVRFGHFNAMKSTVRDVSSYSLALKNDHISYIANQTKALDDKIKVLVAELTSLNSLSVDAVDEKSSQLHAYVKERENLKQLKPVFLHGQRPTYSSESTILENADIICTTCLDSGLKIMLNVFGRIKARDPNRKVICIVDEAMQIIETETIIPLQVGVTDLILFGDSRQLKSVPRCEVTQSLGLNQSLFWRILSIFKDLKDDLSPIVTLKSQYRMNSAISAFPNKLFYNNNLKDRSLNQNRYNVNEFLVLVESVLPKSELCCEMRLHIIAVKLIRVLLSTITSDAPDNSFAIITCRVEHSKNLKAVLSETLEEKVMSKIEVNTIENVQGQEFDIVLFIFDPDMDCSARANVAMTRAKHSLIILTSTSMYWSNKFLNKLSEEALIRGACFSVNTYTEGQLLKNIILKNTENAH